MTMICCKSCDYYYKGKCDYNLTNITSVSPYREACPAFESRLEADLREKAVEQAAHIHYTNFVGTYDEVEINDLSDEDLQAYRNLCENGVIDADREIRKRGL